MKALILVYFVVGYMVGMAILEKHRGADISRGDVEDVLISIAVGLAFWAVIIWSLVRKQKRFMSHDIIFWMIAPPLTVILSAVIVIIYLD